MLVLNARNVNQAYPLGADLIRTMGRETITRNGPAYVLDDPVTTVYHNPTERVLFNAKRDANPFFHLVEAMWILAGRNDVAPLAHFNKRMADYSDNGENFHAGYGFRLRHNGREDQFTAAIRMLRKNPADRRVVLQIWDSTIDLEADRKDIPCNDMIKLRIVNGALDLSVFCRSNDMIWGAYGANVVQFSFIQEHLAHCIGVTVGKYRQISMDFHAYKEVFDKHFSTGEDYDIDDGYNGLEGVRPLPLHFGCVGGTEFDDHFFQLLNDFFETESYKLLTTGLYDTGHRFMDTVVLPACVAFNLHKAGDKSLALELARAIHAEDWRVACVNWLSRRASK